MGVASWIGLRSHHEAVSIAQLPPTICAINVGHSHRVKGLGGRVAELRDTSLEVMLTRWRSNQGLSVAGKTTK